jgi:rubredoxin
MKDSFFSGSFGGDTAKISAATRLECNICWHVYDPAEGDATRQIEAGTSFAMLPDDWSCPVCSGDKAGFMVVED